MKKNVAIIIQKLTGGGAERVAANLSISLSKHYNVFLYVFDTNNITYQYSGTLRRIDKEKGTGIVGKVLNIFRRICVVRRLKSEDHIDVSISLLNFANLVNVLSNVGERDIISIRNNVDNMNSFVERNCVAYAINKADIVVSLSKAVEKQLQSRFGNHEKIKTIYNAVPMFDESSISESNISGRYFVTTGRLTKQKGQWHLIKAMSIVCKKHPDAKLVILGEGELKESLAQLAKLLGIQDNVILYGYCDNPRPIVKGSQAFVFSSLFEGLGNSIVEALALGKCVISTDCTYGPAELLDGSCCASRTDLTKAKYGILVPAFDKNVDFSENIAEKERILAEAMITVLEDTPLRKKYEQLAKKRSLDFSEEIICPQWLNLIES